ncbi:LysM peptidoglycan-binding domain-containing protein [Maribellus mangrovi]|uniref:LysM peptidoglycan-binding domain-containing protein n=1 Tax=Maribellus mangrovi TaxID=3133146 RepID=UPI0030EE4387
MLLLFLPAVSRSQPDTISDFTLQNFTRNLSEKNFYSSESAQELAVADVVFADEFKALDKTLFMQELPLTQKFYGFLISLPESEKELLVTRFLNEANYFESVLKKANLPIELKYLAPALSAMNTKAVGADKRAGIWQLTHLQGILNGLLVNRLVDERFDPVKATRAFADQVQKNKGLFGSVENAVLAYLAGNVTFRNAQARVGQNVSTNDLLAVLPDRVSENLAAYQAVMVFLDHVKVPKTATPKTDTVFVRQKLHFQQVSQVLNIPMNTLKELNPQYTYFIVPGDERRSGLLLPAGKKDDYVIWEDSVFNAFDSTLFEVVAQRIEYSPAPNRQYLGEKVKDLEIEGKTKIKYTIKTGDVLGFIAEDFDVRVADLKYWNNIYNERKIRAGARLDIFVDDDKVDYYRNLFPEPTATSTNAAVAKVYAIPESAKKIEHVVKSGESPYVIAKKYEGVTPEAILYWNGISDARKIQIGQKLTIYETQ